MNTLVLILENCGCGVRKLFENKFITINKGSYLSLYLVMRKTVIGKSVGNVNANKRPITVLSSTGKLMELLVNEGMKFSKVHPNHCVGLGYLVYGVLKMFTSFPHFS